MRIAFVTGLCLSVGFAFADVKVVKDAPIVDGSLDDTCWSTATWAGGFRRHWDARSQVVTDVAEYAFVTDGRSLFFAVKCHCTDFAKVKARRKLGMWSSDTVELFFSPTGVPDDFYQFAVDYQGKRSFCQYYGEAGNITPDPYAPDWKVKVEDLPDGKGWCVEGMIPLSGFYMSRNRDWKADWLVNIGWSNHTMNESTSLSAYKFRDSKHFVRMSGFPSRAKADDFAVTDVTSTFDGYAAGKILGELRMKVFTGVGGEYKLTSPYIPDSVKFNLKAGDNIVKVRCAYPEKGRRFQTELVFTRTENGAGYRRYYPVFVDFESIVVRLTKPCYRNNFYPGQDSSVVEGRVHVVGGAKAELTLDGPGFGTKSCAIASDGSFRFDTTGFAHGDAWLTVVAGDERKRVRIRNLPPSGYRMSWVENKCLVVNGKVGFKRCLTAVGYMGGAALKEKYDTEEWRLADGFNTFVAIEPSKIVKGIEERECVHDVKPCAEVLRGVDAIIDAWKSKDFTGYYLCDEPECRGISPVYLRHLYEYVSEKDPYHVIRIASRAAATYFCCCDLAESHDYLNLFIDENGKRDWRVTPAMIADRIAGHAAVQTPDKVLGCYSTCFAYRWQSFKNDYPTFDEYVASTWAGIINGSRSMQAYAYHDVGDRPATWHGYKYINWSIDALEDIIGRGSCKTLAKTRDWQCVEYDWQGERMFVLVNFTREPQSASVQGLKGRYFEFRGNRTFDGTEFVLNPLEVIIGTSRKRDEGLPSTAEIAALIDREEAARKGRDNQLRGRYEDVIFSMPGVKRYVPSDYKLIDGTLDVIGCFFEHSTNVVCEMSFQNGLKPTFDTVRVYGCNVSNAVVEIRVDGSWRTLRPCGRRWEKYLCELAFPEARSAVKMRIRFPFAKHGKNRVELYEIELPHTDRQPTAAGATGKDVTGSVSTESEQILWELTDLSLQTNRWRKSVKMCADYPWLVMDAKFVSLKSKAYNSWVLACDECRLGSAVTRFVDGLYTFRLPDNLKIKNSLNFWLYNIGAEIARFAVVKEPTNRLRADVLGGKKDIVPGETIRLRLDLAYPCEDVTLKMIKCGKGAYVPFRINGADTIEVKPIGPENRRSWVADVKVKNCGEAKAREVYAVAFVLGGTLEKPVITNFSQPFKSVL